MKLPEFVTIPTKTVVSIDYDALIKLVHKSPRLFTVQEFSVVKMLYAYAEKHRLGKLTVRTIFLVQDGNINPAYLLTLKPPTITQGAAA